MINQITLTASQHDAFERIKGFLTDEEPAIVINGSAGVGKSTLMKYVVTHMVDHKLNVIAVTPTHKAKRVLSNILKKDVLRPIPVTTIASLMGKVREHSYIGVKKFSNGSSEKMDDYDIFIIDEISMVSDADMDFILDYICSRDKKIILIGDSCQIPSPSQKMVRKENMCYKPDSTAFDIVNIITLTEIVRQSKDSHIIKIATYIRDNIKLDNSIFKILDILNIPSEQVLMNSKDIYTSMKNDLDNNLTSRIICYTNANVRGHNINIRKAYNYGDLTFHKGELLTGYTNVGQYPEPLIENGGDYKIIDSKPTCTKKVLKYMNLCGDDVRVKNVDSLDNTYTVFIINIRHSNNDNFLKDLVELAERVNAYRSTKEDFRKYNAHKMKVVFIEDVYKFRNKITNDVELKQLHPLLFTKVTDVIDEKTKKPIPSELGMKIEELYPSMIENRIDDNKPFTESECFADQYKMIEKDIYYGYAITSHKSQGSTYDSVYVDENDFEKIKDRWNHKFRCMEFKIKEKNQIKYVAYTRASKKLSVFL